MAIWLSLKVAIVATVASLPFGIFTAYALARWRFPGKILLNGAVHLPLVLPPVITGFALLLLCPQGHVRSLPRPPWPCLRIPLDRRGPCKRHHGISSDGARNAAIIRVD